ncbi:MAG: NAD-dependent epimerase/dehydratase family protein [Gemmatimonadota bacterium]
MRVFLTGATGFIGGAVAKALLRAGHEVTALLRSPHKRGGLEALGARVRQGDIGVSGTYAAEAARHDVVVHVAMADGADKAIADRVAVDTFLAALHAGAAARRFVYTSGCWVLGDTGGLPAAEDASTDGAAALVRWRPAHERAVLAGSGANATTVVLRPGLVYGGAGSLTADWYRGAELHGAVPLVGDGANHWSFVELADLGALYVALVESETTGVVHGVDNAPVRALDAATAASVAAGAEGRVRHLTLEQGRASLAAVADALTMDQVMVTERAAEIGWNPGCGSYLACVERAYGEWREATPR